MTDAALASQPPVAKQDTPGRRMPAWRLMLFVAPVAVVDLALWPTGYIIPTHYAKMTALSLETIGLVILLSKIIDAVTDPVMGYLADRIETPFGRRKPWLLIGAPIFLVGIFMLLTPTAQTGLAYFAAAWVVMYIGYTIVTVPHNSWQMELVREYDERQRVATYRTVASFGGSMMFMAMPLLMLPITGTTAFTAEVLEIIAWVVVACFALFVPLAVMVTPKEQRLSRREVKLTQMHTLFTNNRPFQIFIAAYLLWGIGAGVWSKLTYLYVDAYLGIPEMFTFILAGTFAMRLLALPMWTWLVRRSEKKTIWMVSVFGLAMVLPIIALVPPGEGAFVWILVLSMLVGVFDAGVMLLPFSMMGDIADYDSYKNNFDRTASFKSMLSLMTKSVLAVGGGAGFMLAGLAGFQATGENTVFSERLFQLIALGIPAASFLMAGVVIRYTSLTRARHREIIEEIERRRGSEEAEATR